MGWPLYWTLMLVLIASCGVCARIAWRQAMRRERLALLLSQEVSRDDSEARYDSAAGERWLDDARSKALWLSETGDVTTDDIWRVCPPPSNVDGRLVAQVFDRSEWAIVDYCRSERGRNSARKIAVWRRKRAEAA